MKAKYCLSFILLTAAWAGYAEVFKCQSAAGKTMYQTSPCSTSVSKQRVLDLKQRTPEEQEQAREKLRSWQDRQSLEEAAKLQAARERQLERERREALELQRRSVIAQEQQAIAAQRQNQYRGGGGFIYPYYSPCQVSPWDRFSWQNQYRPDCDPRYRQYSPMPPYHNPTQTPMPPGPEMPQPKPWPGRPLGTTPPPAKPAPNNSFFAPGR